MAEQKLKPKSINAERKKKQMKIINKNENDLGKLNREIQRDSKEIKKLKGEIKKNKKENTKNPKKVKTSRINSAFDKMLQKLFGDNSIDSTQDTLDYKQVHRDGVIELYDGTYNKMLQFYDINYQLAQKEDKQIIFNNYSDFLNYFDSTIRIQMCFINQKVSAEDRVDSISIEQQDDAFNEIRQEYSGMLNDQLTKGNNGIIKNKYIIYSVKADSYRDAKPKLERIESDIINNFKVLGCNTRPMNGIERLEIIHDIFDNEQDFNFKWSDIPKNGVTTHDVVAPNSINFINPKIFRFNDKVGAVSTIDILAPEMTDRMLAELLELDDNIMVNFHIEPLDQLEAIKMLKSKLSDVDSMKIDEQKKAVQAGYDMDIIPSELNTNSQEIKNILEDCQTRNERTFMITLTVMNISSTKQELENSVFATAGIANKYNCKFRRLEYQQENSLNTSLPIGNNKLDIERFLTTSSLAIFIPFTTQELFQVNGDPLYYGLNALSNNMIMVDRKELMNPNGLILGTPGSGKSFSAKREITNSFLTTTDDIIIADPEGEYWSLVKALNGDEIRISQNSKCHINPLDININYAEDENPIDLKSDFVLSMMEVILGGNTSLTPTHKSIIDRCVRLIYQPFFESEDPKDIPILEDLYNTLRQQEETEAKGIATALEIYIYGSLNVFNNRTNVDLSNRLICFNLKGVGNQLKKLAMLIVQDQVWNRVSENRDLGKATRFYIDEFHLLLKEPETAAFSVEIWKRFRKWNGIPTGLTQNVKDILTSPEIENILENSDFIYLLNQASGDREILAKRLNISQQQLSFVTNSKAGEGLIIYGPVIIPFVDRFPKDTLLYSLMTTKPDEVIARED